MTGSCMVSSSIPVDVSQIGLLLHRRFKELWNRLLFCRSTVETHHLTSQVCHLLLPNHSTWSHSARCIQKIRHMVSNSCDILILCKLVELLTWVIDGYWWLSMVIDGYWWLLIEHRGVMLSQLLGTSMNFWMFIRHTQQVHQFFPQQHDFAPVRTDRCTTPEGGSEGLSKWQVEAQAKRN